MARQAAGAAERQAGRGPWPWLPRGEHALHPLLVVLLLLIVVAQPLTELGLLPGWTMPGGLLLVVLAGLSALDAPGGWLRRWLGALLAAGLLLQALALAGLSAIPAVIGNAGAMLSLGMLAIAILVQVVSPGRITLRRIEGAIAAWVLVGLIFAAAYDLVDTLAPGAFERGGLPRAAAAPQGDFLFFSFITLSTTGYGDLVPVHPMARALAVLEVITGTVFTTVLLARLVALLIADRGEP
jgi:hypothetical protein